MPITRRDFLKTSAAGGACFGISRSGAASFQLGSTASMLTPQAKALVELFGLKYPIFEAPHGRQTCPDLAIAVSNAGAMGCASAKL